MTELSVAEHDDARRPRSIHHVTIIGAGVMGQGIAYVALLAGFSVTVTDATDSVLARGLDAIHAMFDRGVARGKVDDATRTQALGRLHHTSVLADAGARADLVIEAVPEQLALKQQLFATLDTATPAHARLATNTSSLSITAIASAVREPERVIGMHFFNPVHAMKLVELVRGEHTSDDTVADARAVAEAMGKTAIVVRDTPGFATSRLGIVLGLEAMRMLEQGVASAEDIDRAMELGYNHPVGPLKLTDLVGLDVRLAVADHLHATLHDATYAAPDILRRLVAEGKLGKKTGEGFHKWEPTP
jgi:3-hydroxybutyryl-CoA dehydrogenase